MSGVFLGIVLFVVLAVAVVRLFLLFEDRINFFTIGSDQRFSPGEISLLWRLARTCGLESPVSLFYSVESLDRCIGHVIEDYKTRGVLDMAEPQEFLTKLYDFRTKIELDAAQKRGIGSTRSLAKGQKLRVILPGSGVFYTEIVQNARHIVVGVPKQDGLIRIPGDRWKGRRLSVYLWRRKDACYVFDTVATEFGVYNGQSCLFLEQTDSLVRAQKRKSVRAECSIMADLYPISTETVDHKAVETSGGCRCLLEDISEDGALVRIGGRGRDNVQIKLQFELDGTFIMMFGIVRSAEYDRQANQSRLHFECTYLEPNMRNAILSYVYHVIAPEKKEMLDALGQVEEDASAMGDDPAAEFQETAAQHDNVSIEVPDA